tara:strand:+ start:1337 stop:1543 length:207 start_codon:yes stop_codon:yes gene_type:complete
MSNQHNEKEFEKIMQEVISLDEKGKLEPEIHTVCKTYGLDDVFDRPKILFFIAENLFESGVHEDYDTV